MRQQQTIKKILTKQRETKQLYPTEWFKHNQQGQFQKNDNFDCNYSDIQTVGAHVTGLHIIEV